MLSSFFLWRRPINLLWTCDDISRRASDRSISIPFSHAFIRLRNLPTILLASCACSLLLISFLCTENASLHAHTRTFFSLRTPDVITHLAQGLTICLCASKSIPPLVMSLLFFITHCLTDTTYCLSYATDGNQIKPVCNSLWGGPCGDLADPIPNTLCQATGARHPGVAHDSLYCPDVLATTHHKE